MLIFGSKKLKLWFKRQSHLLLLCTTKTWMVCCCEIKRSGGSKKILLQLTSFKMKFANYLIKSGNEMQSKRERLSTSADILYNVKKKQRPITPIPELSARTANTGHFPSFS